MGEEAEVTDFETLYTPDEVAVILKVNPVTVLRWLKKGRLPGFRMGRLWRVRKTGLEKFLKDLQDKGSNVRRW